MSSIIIGGDTSGSVTLSAPAVSGSSVLTLPVATDTLVGKATTDTLTNKTLVAPALGTPASGILTSCTGLNLTTAVTGTLPVGNGGTGVATITTGGLVVGAATSAVTSLNPATAGNSIIDSGTAWTSVAKNWSYRNLSINGEFKVAQRGATITSPASGAYTLDQWVFGNTTAGAVTISQSTAVPDATFANSIKIDVTTADTSIAAGDVAYIRQYVEGLRSSRVGFGAAAAQNLVLSFWGRVDSASLTFPAIFSGSISNSANNRSWPFEYTVTSSAVWQKFTVTITGDTTGTWLQTSGIGLQLTFALACGSTYTGTANQWNAAQDFASTNQVNLLGNTANDLYLTGVQLEVGSIATPFEYRSYGEELALCQRYFWRITRTSTNEDIAAGKVNNTTVGSSATVRYLQEMRAAPTITFSGNTDFNILSAGLATASTVMAANTISTTGFRADITVASGLTAMAGSTLAFGGTSGAYIQASAEL